MKRLRNAFLRASPGGDGDPCAGSRERGSRTAAVSRWALPRFVFASWCCDSEVVNAAVTASSMPYKWAG